MEPVLNLYEAQLQVSKELLTAMLASAQRFDHLVLQAAKETLREQITLAQALPRIHDSPGAASLQKAFPQDHQVRLLEFCGDMLKEILGVYVTLADVAQRYVKDFETNAAGVVQTAQATSTLPMGARFEFWNDGWRQWSAFAEQCMQTLHTNPALAQEAAAGEPERVRSTAKRAVHRK
jgi:hypothetical protein